MNQFTDLQTVLDEGYFRLQQVFEFIRELERKVGGLIKL